MSYSGSPQGLRNALGEGEYMALYKEDAWLTKSVGYKVLSIRDDSIAFAIKLRDLREKDPERFERLFGICERLEFVEQLRHTARMAISHEYEKERHALYQLNRLTTYLMTTCIDIATGERFQNYKTWLSKNYKALDAEDNWEKAIRALSEATDKAEVAKLFVESTASVYEKNYEPNMSIRRSFVNFICSMDDWFKEWLFNDKYVIQLSSSDIFSEDFQEPRWETLDTDGKCERIAHYLYDVRNLYTHTVDYYAPYDTGRFSVSYGNYGVTVSIAASCLPGMFASCLPPMCG
jgi:hypothetical protein